jgi:hypothetical protein
MDAEFPGLVARGGDHAPLGGVPDGQRLAPVFGMVALFYRGIKRVHIDMYDLSHGFIATFSSLLGI